MEQYRMAFLRAGLSELSESAGEAFIGRADSPITPSATGSERQFDLDDDQSTGIQAISRSH